MEESERLREEIKKMKNKLLNLYYRYREIIDYIFWRLTTLVNIVVFLFLIPYFPGLLSRQCDCDCFIYFICLCHK